MTFTLEESSRDYDLVIEKRDEQGLEEKVLIRGAMKKLQKKLILQLLCQLIGISFDASLEAAVADCSRQLEGLVFEFLHMEPEEIQKKLADVDQASGFVRHLESMYSRAHSDDEMDEGLLVRSSSVGADSPAPHPPQMHTVHQAVVREPPAQEEQLRGDDARVSLEETFPAA